MFFLKEVIMDNTKVKEHTPWENEIVTKGEWLIVILLTCIPIVNIAVHGIIVIRKKEKLSLSNFSFVMFWILLITYLITILKLFVK